MSNQKKLFNRLAISGVALSLLLSVCTYTQSVNAAENGVRTVKYTYEQLVKKYPSMEDYIAKTRKSIKNNWYPPVKSFENSAIIILTINKDGTLANCYLSQPSDDEGFNNSLIEAAKKVKYAPLPDEVKDNSIDIDMLFNMQRRHISQPSMQG